MTEQTALNGFLREVERRALRMAELSTGNREDALEIVQEAMMGLCSRYASRPAAEWKPLFYRILSSRINDFHRRRAVRSRVMSLLPWKRADDSEAGDPLEQFSDDGRHNPDRALDRATQTESMLAAIGHLPPRQQQAFLLRAWEGLSVRETASTMSCSEGSVKTHYARAVRSLRRSIETPDH